MKKRHHQKSARVPKVDPSKLKFCLLAGGSASEGRDPKFKFDPGPINIDGDTFRLTNTPLNRFGWAVKQHCGSAGEFMAMMSRLFAVFELAKDPEAPPEFVRDAPHGKEICDSAIELAAVFPLKGAAFDRTRFYEKLRSNSE